MSGLSVLGYLIPVSKNCRRTTDLIDALGDMGRGMSKSDPGDDNISKIQYTPPSQSFVSYRSVFIVFLEYNSWRVLAVSGMLVFRLTKWSVSKEMVFLEESVGCWN